MCSLKGNTFKACSWKTFHYVAFSNSHSSPQSWWYTIMNLSHCNQVQLFLPWWLLIWQYKEECRDRVNCQKLLYNDETHWKQFIRMNKVINSARPLKQFFKFLTSYILNICLKYYLAIYRFFSLTVWFEWVYGN